MVKNIDKSEIIWTGNSPSFSLWILGTSMNRFNFSKANFNFTEHKTSYRYLEDMTWLKITLNSSYHHLNASEAQSKETDTDIGYDTNTNMSTPIIVETWSASSYNQINTQNQQIHHNYKQWVKMKIYSSRRWIMMMSHGFTEKNDY